MFENKYSKVLTVVLIIVIVAILGLLGFLAVDIIQKNSIQSDAEAFVSQFESDVGATDQNGENTNTNSDGNSESNPLEEIEATKTVINGGSGKQPTYKGYNVVGIIKIPQINLEYPIIERVTKDAIEASVAKLYPMENSVNKVGNTVIIGHNYRNGLFFSRNKELKVNDKIYITDNSGNRLTYTIYNKFETTPEDTSFYTRDTDNKPEITLSTCNDDSSKRLIILAKAE